MTISEIITAIKDVILAGSAIATVTIAILGLKSWSRELKGKASFDVARGLIRSTYKLRDQLGYSRSPLTAASEFPKDYDPIQRDRGPDKEAEAWSYIFTNRWKPVAEAQIEFESQVLEAEALWGAEIKSKTDELCYCSRILHVAMEEMIENKASGNRIFNNDPDYAKKIKADVWTLKNDTNILSQKINNAVAAIESSVRPHIQRN